MSQHKKEAAKFLLRLDPAVMEAIRQWAEADLRSVNGQIEYLLRDALSKRDSKFRSMNTQAKPGKTDT